MSLLIESSNALQSFGKNGAISTLSMNNKDSNFISASASSASAILSGVGHVPIFGASDFSDKKSPPSQI